MVGCLGLKNEAGEAPMIHTLRLQNFKGIRDVEVGLERLTVFVGPNASGKTSLLQGLDLLVNTPELSASRKNLNIVPT